MQNVIREAISAVPSPAIDLFPDVNGMTTPKVRHLLNSLVRYLPKEESYLEIGIHQGGTLIPAVAGNKMVDVVACDNWSQFEDTDRGSAKALFYQNLAIHHQCLPIIRIVDLDVWKFLSSPDFKKPVGLVFYDGDHKEEDQRRLFSAMHPHLAKNSIVIIDDYDHPTAKSGSELGIKDNAWKEVDFVYVPGSSGFHNGLGIYYLTK